MILRLFNDAVSAVEVT